MTGTAKIGISGATFDATDEAPFVFGRTSAVDLIGLNPDDMGVSAVAGSIEAAWGVWWVVNQSAKRRLLLELDPGASPTPIECGHRAALVTERARVLVPGALYTYALEVLLDPAYAASLQHREATGSGTIVPGAEVRLNDNDRIALAALFAGTGWTEKAISRRIEKIRESFRGAGLSFEGERAREDLAAHLISNGLLTGADLERLPGR